MIRAILVVLASIAVGCGGTVVGTSLDGGPGSDGAGGGDGGRDSPGTDGPIADTGTPWSPVCPEGEPTPGTPCTLSPSKDSAPALCEYGQLNYDPSCDAVYQCQAGVWSKASSVGGTCQPDGPNPSSCPATYADIQEDEAGTCAQAGLRCEYAEGVCLCSAGFAIEIPDGGTTWSCNPGPGCPMPRPRLGSSCTSSNMSCTYLTCDFSESCTDGYWQGQFEACAGVGGAP